MENNRGLRRVWEIGFCAAAVAGSMAAAWRPRRFCHALGAKLNMAVAIGVTLTSSSCARTVEGGERRQVLVCMERGSDPSFLMPPAQALTTRIFDQIGVALVWRGLEHCPEELRPIVIRVSLDTLRDVSPGALAESYPFEGVHIRVFYDRVRIVTDSCPLPVLLAHVLAHEIGHILQRTNAHSASGVMKSRWDMNDYTRMARQPLPFTDLDIQLIHRGLGAASEERAADGSRPLPPPPRKAYP